jgi:hypothetical protein
VWSTLSYYKGFKSYKLPLGKRKQSVFNSVTLTCYDSPENAKTQERLCMHITRSIEGMVRLKKEERQLLHHLPGLTKFKNYLMISHHYPLSYLLDPRRSSKTN